MAIPASFDATLNPGHPGKIHDGVSVAASGSSSKTVAFAVGAVPERASIAFDHALAGGAAVKTEVFLVGYFSDLSLGSATTAKGRIDIPTGVPARFLKVVVTETTGTLGATVTANTEAHTA